MFSVQRALMTQEIMRSKDAQCNSMESPLVRDRSLFTGGGMSEKMRGVGLEMIATAKRGVLEFFICYGRGPWNFNPIQTPGGGGGGFCPRRLWALITF